ncbi:hypothetical protein BVRB_041870, partial [Beta vulgaris subsp. vulgaris]
DQVRLCAAGALGFCYQSEPGHDLGVFIVSDCFCPLGRSLDNHYAGRCIARLQSPTK